MSHRSLCTTPDCYAPVTRVVHGLPFCRRHCLAFIADGLAHGYDLRCSYAPVKLKGLS